MKKPDLLRQALSDALPHLKREPERLAIFIDEGRIACTAVPSGGLSFRYDYSLNAVLLDFAGDENLVLIAVLSFLARYQPELLRSYETNAEAIAFQAEVLDDKTIDLELKLRLSERVKVTPRAGQPGKYDYLVLDEPQEAPHGWNTQHWQIYAGDELLAEWDVPA